MKKSKKEYRVLIGLLLTFFLFVACKEKDCATEGDRGLFRKYKKGDCLVDTHMAYYIVENNSEHTISVILSDNIKNQITITPNTKGVIYEQEIDGTSSNNTPDILYISDRRITIMCADTVYASYSYNCIEKDEHNDCIEYGYVPAENNMLQSDLWSKIGDDFYYCFSMK